MAGALLESKTHRPRGRAGQVRRMRLLERLHAARDARVVLVSAPAGFGKTTLVAQWLADPSGEALADEPRAVAWLSVDARDNEPAVFWRYVVAALRTAAAGVGGGALAQLEPPGASVDAALATLVNDLQTLDRDTVLVIDDYHLVGSTEIHEEMAFFIEHLPPRLQLVLASRADPMLPLARLRARGELVEVRAADLRFTPAEASAYLTDAMGLRLSDDDVATLENRTEGWIAALQLAALSLRDRVDAAAFIADFAGDDRYVVDFLVEEVLARQTADVRSFLMSTSVLRTLSGALCDAVTGRADSAEVLRELERANLFVVALDDRRRLYRYHHLFGDVLQARLREEQPALIPELHRRARVWHEEAGDRREAIRHALAGDDVESAARLLELELPALQRDRQEATLRTWIDALPDEVIRARPVLGVAFVGSRMVRGELEGVEERLRDVERWLAAQREQPDGGRPPGMVVTSEERFRALPAAVAVYRAAQARIGGDVPGTIAHAQRALDVMAPGDSLERGAAAALLGLAHWTAGDVPTGAAWYTDAMGVFERTGYWSDVAGCAIAAMDMHLTLGSLRAAYDVVAHVLDLVSPAGGPVLRGAADMHVAMSQLLRERGDPDGAVHHLAAARDLGEHLGLAQNPYRWRVATAQLRLAEGDPGSALALLEEAERVYTGDFSPDVRPVAATRARALLAAGDLDGALDWVRRRGVSAADGLSYLREYEHLVLARVLLARHAADGDARDAADATGLLQRLVAAARAGGRHGAVLEALVLLATAHAAVGDRAGARSALVEAVAIAEPEGYVGTFADDGSALAPVLTDLLAASRAGSQPGEGAAEAGPSRSYLVRLLAACTGGAPPPHGPPSVAARGRSAVLPEPLSSRELEVLRLLAGDLDGPGIARHLVVSVHTVRTHTKSIYAKLGVNSRRAAVRRATELDLIPGAAR